MLYKLLPPNNVSKENPAFEFLPDRYIHFE